MGTWPYSTIFARMTATQTPLRDDEIDAFVKALDTNKDGRISKGEIEAKLFTVQAQLKLHANRAVRTRKKGSTPKEIEQGNTFNLKAFVESLLPTSTEDSKDFVSASDFKQAVRSWNVPSLEQEKRQEYDEHHYLDKVPLRRKIRAWWGVLGPELIFLCMVVGLQVGLGVWQCLEYALSDRYQAAFGWGVALAKFSAGALYGTIFFLLLSMSRWWSTALRRFYYVSRFINWDHAQSFHIVMSVEAVLLATLHAIGHLSGTFVFASSASRQAAVDEVLDGRGSPNYIDYLHTIAGASGLAALGLFYTISLLSMPVVRRWSYEVFQAGHLLMYPIIGLVMCHGSAKLLQYPVLGFIIALPTALVLVERTTRLVRSFRHFDAKVCVLDDDTISVACDIPDRRIWPYEAGQYVFLQVPQLSYFQWHPFTISMHVGRTMRLHIKTDGDWTGRLRKIAEEAGGKASIRIGLDGPFGAPAQRFYNYDQAIVVGAGIGITPFSSILNDLQAREDHRWHMDRVRPSRRWNRSQRSSFSGQRTPQPLVSGQSTPRPPSITQEQASRPLSQSSQAFTVTAQTLDSPASILPSHEHVDLNLYRRVDMHWIVRDKDHLHWFSDLLNDVVSGKGHVRDHLDIRVNNHVTQKHKDVSLHVFRWLLERYRGESQEAKSPLTGMYAPTHFGRPDFDFIMHQHYEDMKVLFASNPERKRRIGVFFCGAPVIGAQLADLCSQLTIKGVQEKNGIQYEFRTEVFN